MCEAPLYRPPVLIEHVQAAELEPLTTVEEMRAYATARAVAAGVDPDVVLSVISCESHWISDARGDEGLARGLVQIRSDFWPDISDAQADDPRYAINFLVGKLQNNQGKLWSCLPPVLRPQ